MLIRQELADSMSSLLTGQRNIDGRGPFMLRRLESYLWRAASVSPVRNVWYQMHAGVADCARADRYRLLDVEQVVCSDADGRVRTVAQNSTHAWYAGSVREVRDDVQALTAVTAPGFEPAETVVLLPEDAAVVEPVPAGPTHAAIALLDASAHRQEWRVDTAGPGVFVVSELAYPGWVVRVNGVRRPGLRANFLLRGVALGRGTWVVTWQYEPASYRVGGALCAAAALALLGGAVAVWRRGQRYSDADG